MHFISEKILPAGNLCLQLANFSHECLKLDVELYLETVVGDEFESLLDEGEDGDLFVRVEHAIFVDVEDAHKVFDGADARQTVQVCLVLPKHHLQDLLRQIGTSHVVLGERTPNGLALLCGVLIGLCLSLDLSDDGWVEGVEGVE